MYIGGLHILKEKLALSLRTQIHGKKPSPFFTQLVGLEAKNALEVNLGIGRNPTWIIPLNKNVSNFSLNYAGPATNHIVPLGLKQWVIDLRLSENYKISICGWICNCLQLKAFFFSAVLLINL